MTIVIVISDLHMGSGPVDDFDPEIEKLFLKFLDEWKSRGDAVELVINGDFLDFVQAPPYDGASLRSSTSDGIPLCFREEHSIQKLEAIARDHGPALRALGDFLEHRSTNRVVVMPGNHDADFFWPRVQAEFRWRVCEDKAGVTERLLIWLQPVYRPDSCPQLWIEHGHQLDPVNSFYVNGRPCWSEKEPPILADKLNIPRLYECVGTRFLIQFLNRIDEQYPYVDNVKPFSRFLQIFGASAMVPGYAPLRAAVAMGSITKFLAKMLATNPRDVFSRQEDNTASAATAILRAYQASPPEKRERFLSETQARGFNLTRGITITLSNEASAEPFMSFLEDNLDLLDVIDREIVEGTLKLAAGFVAKESDDLKEHAFNVVSDPANSAECVIMGHTHEAVNEPYYINTGSWTRYYQVAAKERLRPWSLLRAKAWKSFPYKLHFAIAEPGASPVASFRSYN